MKNIFTTIVGLLVCLSLFAQQPQQKSINVAYRNVPAEGVLSSGPIPDMNAFTAEGVPIKVRDLCIGKYTVLAAGCLTCPLFHQNYPEIEAAYADYKDKGVQLFYFYKFLRHPELDGYVQAQNICGPIGYADYEVPGSEELGKNIAKEFENDKSKAVIMENHGTVLGGVDLMDAYERFETLEFCARTIINARAVGEPNFLSDEQIAQFENQIPRNVARNVSVSYPPQERKIRQKICNIVRRACDQGLMISTYGTVSVRWKDDDFLITPPYVPRWDIAPEDIVQISGGAAEAGKTPSRSMYLHQKIYQENPSINSIILTQPPNLMAFGTTGVKFDVRTIPESWIFLQDVPVLPFGSHFHGNDTIPQLVGENTPAVLVANDSFIVTGDKLLQTFDRLEVAEFSARSLVLAVPLGKLVPINEDQVEALRKKFLG